MTATNRPKRVVIVDADNPMVEIHGAFFWKEDHEVLLAEAHRVGYEAGYRAGATHTASQQPQTVVLRRAPSIYRRIQLIIALAVLSVFMLIIISTIAEQLVRQL